MKTNKQLMEELLEENNLTEVQRRYLKIRLKDET